MVSHRRGARDLATAQGVLAFLGQLPEPQGSVAGVPCLVPACGVPLPSRVPSSACPCPSAHAAVLCLPRSTYPSRTLPKCVSLSVPMPWCLGCRVPHASGAPAVVGAAGLSPRVAAAVPPRCAAAVSRLTCLASQCLVPA